MARAAKDEFFVRCASGFEGVLADELKDLGLRRLRPLVGGVSFHGYLRDAYRCCLWSRVATRVQLVLARVGAATADELYAGVAAIPWEDLVVPGATVAVRAHGTNAALRNTQFSALRVKDALCDRLRDRRSTRPDVDAKDPDFSLDVAVHERKATVCLNLSGPSLHRRGYREQGVQTEAPMKETLAAGMLLAAGWRELAREGAAFVDPMCGSGTLAIEAALIAGDVAPGLLRERWGFQGWLGHDKGVWKSMLEEARSRRAEGTCHQPLIVGGDVESSAIGIARANARRAQVDSAVRFVCRNAEELQDYLSEDARGNGGKRRVPAHGLMAVNPPYGRRLRAQEGLSETYAALRAATGALPQGWRLAVITPDKGVDTALGLTPNLVIDCYNGPIRSAVHLYTTAPARRLELAVTSLAGRTVEVPVSERNSEQFAARLRKVAKQRVKWARKAGVSCYRVYDADLPDYALAVDVFEGAGPEAGRRFVRVGEYPPPGSVDANRAARRLADAAAIAPAVLDVSSDDLRVVEGRATRDAHGRLEKSTSALVHVSLGVGLVELDLAGREDGGFPLHHRMTYAKLSEMARDQDVLCLFSYAGAPTLHAAAGGARSTTTVDGGKGFAAWAERTLRVNGFGGAHHRVVQDDPHDWLERERRSGRRYGLIFCDLPGGYVGDDESPRFSRGGDSPAVTAFVVDLCALLASGGQLVFACDQNDPVPNISQIEEQGLDVQEISAQTIPHDFERTPRVHRCWVVARTKGAGASR